jgi:TolB-like protein/Flp pilus assembly protein TadD
MSGDSSAVFLSYASENAQAVQRIADALRAAGIEVWFDREELRGGDAWDRRIREQIRDCRLFVPVISAQTEARAEGYFRREWRLAIERAGDMAEDQLFLVPIVIDGTSERSARVPESFRQVQWTRLPGGETSTAFVERVQRLLSPTGPVELMHPAAGAESDIIRDGPTRAAAFRSKAGWLRPALLVTALTVVAGGVYVAIERFVPAKRAALGPPIVDKSIAVLPFADMSEKHDQEYFADGMAEEIIDLLAKVPELKVIGRTSSFQFKGKTEDLRNIGRSLDTAYVVEGSVRRSGNHVRVTAQLIDSRDGTHRWSETYDRDASDVMKVQDEIAASLVRALQLEVSPSSQSRSPPRNAEAYDAFLRGMHALDRYDTGGMDEAIAAFRRSLVLDPDFSPAAEGLAWALFEWSEFGFVRPQEGFEQTRSAASAAIRLDPRSGRAHAVLAGVHIEYDWNWQAAAKEVETALALSPNDPVVLTFAAKNKQALGQCNEAKRFIDDSLARDPLNPASLVIDGWINVCLGRLQDAERAYRRVLEIAPTYSYSHYFLGVDLLLQGKADAAVAEMQSELPDGRLPGLALAYFAAHRSKEADLMLAELEKNSADASTWGYENDLAESYALRDQKDEAFRWIDRAYTQKDVDLYRIKSNGLLTNLKPDPRWKSFLRKMNLPE